MTPGVCACLFSLEIENSFLGVGKPVPSIPFKVVAFRVVCHGAQKI